jgi:hypothetical protein
MMFLRNFTTTEKDHVKALVTPGTFISRTNVIKKIAQLSLTSKPALMFRKFLRVIREETVR